MSECLQASLVNRLDEIEKLAARVDEFCRQNQIAAKDAYAINVSLDELVTNVISYGYEDKAEHRIEIQLRMDNGWVEARIDDDARAFNPMEKPPPDLTKPLAERPIGGLGIHIVRKMMDSVSYRRQDGKNVLVLRKKVVANS
ncbi:MAG: ATP-binding protein [Verrucomicrobiae bacterium]|nr:ATP-binding protein [Verrucomicrobiae bacterium]